MVLLLLCHPGINELPCNFAMSMYYGGSSTGESCVPATLAVAFAVYRIAGKLNETKNTLRKENGRKDIIDGIYAALRECHPTRLNT